jgi:hypothetical protein
MSSCYKDTQHSFQNETERTNTAGFEFRKKIFNMNRKAMGSVMLVLHVVVGLVAAGGLLEQEPILAQLLKDPLTFQEPYLPANIGFNYTIEQIRDIASNYNAGDYPQFDSFKNATIRTQIRKNILAICNQMISLSTNG